MSSDRYSVKLLVTKDFNSEVLFTSELYKNYHDAKEFVKWFAHKVSTKFPYMIEKNSTPIELAYRPPKKCKHSPDRPLTLAIKKKRLKTRIELGLYYEY